MSDVSEIKGLVGGHLHIKVTSKAWMGRKEDYEWDQERVFPLCDVDIVNGPVNIYLRYKESSFQIDESQYEILLELLATAPLDNSITIVPDRYRPEVAGRFGSRVANWNGGGG